MPVCVGVADVVDEWSEAILTSINQSPLAPRAGFDDKSLLRLHPLTQLNHSTRFPFDFIDLTLTSSTHTNLVPFFLPPAFEHPKPLRTVGIEINTGQTWSCLLIFAINIYIKATRTLFLCFASHRSLCFRWYTWLHSRHWVSAVDSTTFRCCKSMWTWRDKRIEERQ